MCRNFKNCYLIESLFFVLVFACFSVATCFTQPKIDDHIFSVCTELNFSSVFSYSFAYGNGRLFGNTIAILFSHLYLLKPLFSGFILSTLSIMLYKLFFDHNIPIFLAISLLVLFPSILFFENSYAFFPSFANYVVPFTFAVSSLVLFKSYKFNNDADKKSGVLKLVFAFLLNFVACFFSENTTIVIITMSVLLNIRDFLLNKKLSVSNFVMLASSGLGGLGMLLIPHIFGVSEKLDGYHSVSFKLTDIVGNIMLICDIISILIIPISLLSFSFVLTYCKRKKTFIDYFLLCYLVCYSGFIVVYNELDYNNAFFRLMITFLSIFYLISISVLSLKFKDKDIKYTSFGFCILISISIASMIFVNIVGPRTHYTTFILILMLAFYLISKNIKTNISSSALKSAISLSLSAFLLFSTVFCFSYNVKNFDNYVIENELGYKQNEEEFGERFGTGFSPQMYTYAFEKIEYLDPEISNLWPRDTWMEVLQ